MTCALCKASSLLQPKLCAYLFNTITFLLQFWKLVTCACSKTILPEEGKKCTWPEHQLQNQHSYFFHVLCQLPEMLRVVQLRSTRGGVKTKSLRKETGQIWQLRLLHAPSLNELPLCSCDQTASEHNRKQCITGGLASYLLTPRTFN